MSIAQSRPCPRGALAIEAERLEKRFRGQRALAGVDLAGRPGNRLRAAGTERRRQDHHGADTGHPARARRRPSAGGWP